jgi:hypothetical protein
MLEHVWTVLCKRVSTDKETSAISYLTCLEQLETNVLPATLPGCAVDSVWAKSGEDEERLRFRLRLLHPGEASEIIAEGDVKVTERRQHLKVSIGEHLFPRDGTYRFLLEKADGEEWAAVSSIPFDVVYRAVRSGKKA